MKIMQLLGLATLLGTSSVGCANSQNQDGNVRLVEYQPDITAAKFKEISNASPKNLLRACEISDYWQHQGDRVVFGDEAAKIYQLGFEDAKAGKGALDKAAIKAKALEIFDAGWEIAFETAKKAAEEARKAKMAIK